MLNDLFWYLSFRLLVHWVDIVIYVSAYRNEARLTWDSVCEGGI